jgi:hypothetical protein
MTEVRLVGADAPGFKSEAYWTSDKAARILICATRCQIMWAEVAVQPLTWSTNRNITVLVAPRLQFSWISNSMSSCLRTRVALAKAQKMIIQLN